MPRYKDDPFFKKYTTFGTNGDFSSLEGAKKLHLDGCFSAMNAVGEFEQLIVLSEECFHIITYKLFDPLKIFGFLSVVCRFLVRIFEKIAQNIYEFLILS